MRFCSLFFIATLFYACTHSDFKKDGGIRIVMEASQGDLLKDNMYGRDSIALAAINETYKEYQQQQGKSFYDLYFNKLEKADPHRVAGAHFSVDGLLQTATAAECAIFFDKKLTETMDQVGRNLAKRIDGFGITGANITKGDQPGLLVVELPGKNINIRRVRKLLQSSSHLEFWETYDNEDAYPLLQKLNDLLGKEAVTAPADTVAPGKKTVTEKTTLRAQLDEQQTAEKKAKESNAADIEKARRENPVFALLNPPITNSNDHPQLIQGPMVGYAQYKDTAKINVLLANDLFKNIKYRNMKFLWSAFPLNNSGNYQLIAVKGNQYGEAELAGNVIESARVVFEKSSDGNPEISVTMTKYAAGTWRKMTRDNIGKSIAIVLDGHVFSWPTVMGEISGGASSITGNFSLDDAKDLANALSAGSFPISMRIVEESIVAPAGK